MSFKWSFSPDEPLAPLEIRQIYRPMFREKKKPSSWIAPEHARMSLGMKRDYPRNERGEITDKSAKRLVLDKRPTILVPAPKLRYLFL